MKIGFIGLGNVGGKLAGSLIRNNFDVTVREIDESLTNEFKKLGAKVAKSPKELAEHLMLLDLGRNDVGRVSKIGSINVRESFQIQETSHLFHITLLLKAN